MELCISDNNPAALNMVILTILTTLVDWKG